MSSSSTSIHVTPLVPSIKEYEWGKIGNSSVVAQLGSRYQKIDNNKPYAELWMGTHPSGHSKCSKHDNIELQSYIKDELPFLFKVLSIGKALSIQAHPDKQLAAVLHKRDPTNYKDDNHKPEMAIAVTPFSGMCGFRDLQQISNFLQDIPILQDIIGKNVCQEFIQQQQKQNTTSSSSSSDARKQQIKELFAALMNVSESTLKQYLPTLITELKAKHPNHKSQQNGATTPAQQQTNGHTNKNQAAVDLDAEVVVLQLYDDFQYDVGVLCPFLLNCVSCSPGQALFLGPNVPHAYLSGDIVECMAQSDNVVRAGLTPKFRDVNTLIDMLTYETGYVTQLHPQSIDTHTVRYAPDSKEFPEFALTQTRLNNSNQQYTLKAVKSHSILLVYSGDGVLTAGSESHELSKGVILFLPANVDVHIKNSNSTSDLLLYRCSPNL